MSCVYVVVLSFVMFEIHVNTFSSHGIHILYHFPGYRLLNFCASLYNLFHPMNEHYQPRPEAYVSYLE